APPAVVPVAVPPQPERPALVGLEDDDRPELAEGASPRPPRPLGGAGPQLQADVQAVADLVVQAPVAGGAAGAVLRVRVEDGRVRDRPNREPSPPDALVELGVLGPEEQVAPRVAGLPDDLGVEQSPVP